MKKSNAGEEVVAMKSSRIFFLALLCSAGLIGVAACGTRESAETGQDEDAPGAPARPAQRLRAPLEYGTVEGSDGALRQAILYSQKLPSLGSTLEIRSMLLLTKRAALPADRETLYEVLAGEVESEGDGGRKSHATGDLWMVAKGARVTVKAKGEMAVLRAIAAPGK
jgi:hypothetical protein